KLGRIQSEKSDHKQKTPKTGIQKNHALNGKKNVAKNNKQKPPNTLLSSQTTDLIVTTPQAAQKTRGQKAATSSAD
ncbi:hypothetical protein, partial [Mycolicibacterium chitae]|uniref:hypothetical protein n=1 Tax=Mycolicibacterium chitae TaxID=1792 RepID=UPI0021F2CFC7